MSHSEVNKRIAKNSLLLYTRMIVVMVVNLYTSRLVLRALGVDDYGIYNVVGGLVTFFSLINGGMVTATQRFINVGIGEGDQNKLSTIFRTSITIHAIIAIIVVVLGETLGLWILNNKFQISPSQLSDAQIVFQFSIATVALQILILPFNAITIAYEKMSVYAWISILQALITLTIAACLTLFSTHRLIFYAILMFVVPILNGIIYYTYCKRHFPIISNRNAKWNKSIFKDMSVFAGWCMVGISAGMLYTQGLNILLGIFFQPFVNAARGLAVNIQSAVNQIFNNAQTAVVPQLIQSYARRDFQYFYNLIFKSSKLFAFLAILVAVPLGVRAPYIINLWLGELPEYVVIFARILLGVTIVDAISGPLMRASDATGNIRLYHLVVGGTLLTIVPIAYIFLKLGYPPQTAFYTYLGVSIAALICRLFILKIRIQLSISKFIRLVLLPVLTVLVCTLCISGLLSYYCSNNFGGFILFVFGSLSTSIVIMGFLGINSQERQNILNKIREIKLRFQ